MPLKYTDVLFLGKAKPSKGQDLRPGQGISIDEEGNISVNTATSSSLGIVRPDNSSVFVKEDGTIYATNGGPVSPYTAGEGIQIQDFVISADFDRIQKRLTVGKGVAISYDDGSDTYAISAVPPALAWHTNNTGTELICSELQDKTLIKVYKNGILLQPEQDYIVSGIILSLNEALEAEDKIITEYQ